MIEKTPEGKVTLSIPAVVVTAAITACVTIFGSWFAQRDAKAAGQADCLTEARFTEYMRARDTTDRDWKDRMVSDLTDIKLRLGIVERTKP